MCARVVEYCSLSIFCYSMTEIGNHASPQIVYFSFSMENRVAVDTDDLAGSAISNHLELFTRTQFTIYKVIFLLNTVLEREYLL